jgi:hypothetical protein
MGCGGKDLESSPLAPRLAPCRTCTFRGVDIGTSPLYALKTVLDLTAAARRWCSVFCP